MPRTFWCLLLTLLASPALRAELVCEQPVVELGSVKAGVPLTHRFSVINKGSATIELVGLSTSCGCLRPEPSKRVLAAGEATTLELKGNTLALPAGPQSWRLRLAYREAGEQREIALEIRATLLVEVAVVPPTLVLTTDGTLSHELSLRDTRSAPLAVTAVQTTAPGLRARLGEPQRRPEGGWTRPITVEVGADYPPGRADEWLVLYSRDPDYPELRIPVTVHKHARGSVVVRPAEVIITGTPGEPLPARRVLLGDATAPVEVERIDTGHTAIRCTHAAVPGSATTLRVRVDAAQVPETGLESAVRVHRKMGEPIVIPVRVEWRRP